MIQVSRLTREFDGDGVFDISLSVEKGQALGLLGPAGAGKSVLLRVLAGLLRPDEGSATIFGLDAFTRRHEIFKNAVYAPAVPQFMGTLTGEQALRFAERYHGRFNPEKARRLVERMDIPLTGLFNRMGVENRKKLGLLTALSLDADVFLLDEPMNGLSPENKAVLADTLKDLAKAGSAILLTTHVLEEARKSCSQVAILRKGRVIVTQPVEALSLTRQKVYHVTFSSAREAAAFAAEWEQAVELMGTRAMVAIPASPLALLKTLARYEVVDLIGGREDAETGFLRFYGDDIV